MRSCGSFASLGRAPATPKDDDPVRAWSSIDLPLRMLRGQAELASIAEQIQALKEARAFEGLAALMETEAETDTETETSKSPSSRCRTGSDLEALEQPDEAVSVTEITAPRDLLPFVRRLMALEAGETVDGDEQEEGEEEDEGEEGEEEDEGEEGEEEDEGEEGEEEDEGEESEEEDEDEEEDEESEEDEKEDDDQQGDSSDFDVEDYIVEAPGEDVALSVSNAPPSGLQARRLMSNVAVDIDGPALFKALTRRRPRFSGPSKAS